jgi:hypothetical protein
VTELVHQWHWTQGNGALPFPGRRVESKTEERYGDLYTITEYLGNDMAVSYRQIIDPAIPAPEAAKWAWMEREFRNYLEEGPR